MGELTVQWQNHGRNLASKDSLHLEAKLNTLGNDLLEHEESARSQVYIKWQFVHLLPTGQRNDLHREEGRES
ncbi:hypothetical protein PN36_35000 [Candidatus Thiomargarita nelsonii]|uniref:Uncharacterized protein n=1 Tax=Candidatus Thiomargarita nelsonii TaxID=1003181 RepID=A0A4E0QLU1_9GAMM|nr:hypothetical protein PN36_35000 [Candidatus Thiomargarita nelsonii]